MTVPRALAPLPRHGDRLRGGAAFTTRAPIGWQTMLADLSLILFMVTAAAMADVPDGKTPAPSAARPATSPAMGQPLAIWRPAPGGPGLGPWLAEQQVDSRQLLSITLRYPPALQKQALEMAQAMAAQAGAAGTRARIVIEPVAGGGQIDAMAALAYDKGPA